MSKKQITFVYYFISEDYDNEDTLNAYSINMGKNLIRLQHVYDTFPLKGSYVFRFKIMYDGVVAWLDLPELETKLPTFKDRIIMKATRISWQANKEHPYGHYRFLKREYISPQFQSSGSKKQVPKQPQSSFKQLPKQDKPKPQSQSKVETANLLDEKHEPQIKTQILSSDFDFLSSPSPASNSNSFGDNNLI